MLAQLGKHLFQVGHGDTVTLRQILQRHRRARLAQGQVNHGGYGKTTACTQSHEITPSSTKVAG
jgi:hypothetical protein